MSIEIKEVRNDVSTYKKFGWKPKEEKSVRHAKRHHTVYVLCRDNTIHNYHKIVCLENEYMSLKSKLRNYEPAKPFYVFITFILFIFPLFIYLYKKSSEKKEIEENNAKIKKRMNEILIDAERLVKNA